MKEIDTLEMLLQALIYEEETQIDLNDFFSSSNMKITHPVLMQIYHVLMQNRQKKIKVVNLNHKVKNKTNN